MIELTKEQKRGKNSFYHRMNKMLKDGCYILISEYYSPINKKRVLTYTLAKDKGNKTTSIYFHMSKELHNTLKKEMGFNTRLKKYYYNPSNYNPYNDIPITKEEIIYYQ